MTAVPLSVAASELGMRPGTLRRHIRAGCPAVHGRRGRGHATLVDPEAARAWLAAGSGERAIVGLADELPRILARAAHEAWQLAEGIDKRRMAGVLAAAWYLSATQVLDYLRTLEPGIKDIDRLPEEIERMREIARR